MAEAPLNSASCASPSCMSKSGLTSSTPATLSPRESAQMCAFGIAASTVAALGGDEVASGDASASPSLAAGLTPGEPLGGAPEKLRAAAVSQASRKLAMACFKRGWCALVADKGKSRSSLYTPPLELAACKGPIREGETSRDREGPLRDGETSLDRSGVPGFDGNDVSTALCKVPDGDKGGLESQLCDKDSMGGGGIGVP
mmetsp:Transcript_86754/g.194144  ORF Transcript_86754/g.194144 Transcript_86754/m.194144 type:complete len:200 (-) Transcript_86754:132-731(-)